MEQPTTEISLNEFRIYNIFLRRKVLKSASSSYAINTWWSNREIQHSHIYQRNIKNARDDSVEWKWNHGCDVKTRERERETWVRGLNGWKEDTTRIPQSWWHGVGFYNRCGQHGVEAFVKLVIVEIAPWPQFFSSSFILVSFFFHSFGLPIFSN